MRIAKLILVPIAAALVLPASAGATTFCVGEPAGCSGLDLSAGQLDSGAMHSSLLSNGAPDEIVLGAGTFSDPQGFSLGGIDPVEIRGAGRDATVLTSTSATTGVLLNLDSFTRPVTLRHLAVEVPPTWLDGNIQTHAIRILGHVEDVRVISQNPHTTGIEARGTSTLRRVEITAAQGAAVRTECGGTDLTVEDSRLTGRTGIDVGSCAMAPVTVDVERSIVTASSGNSVGAALYSSGAVSTIRDSLLKVRSDGITRAAGVIATSGSVVADHLTIVRDGGPLDETIGIWAHATGNGNAQINLTNAVVSGVGEPGRREGSGAGYTGTAKVVIAHNLLPAAFPLGTGKGYVVNGLGNLVAPDPGFVNAIGGDFRLLAASPAIDSGDDEFADSTRALDGLPRVVDGNGDGAAVTDRGAYEAPAPSPAQPTDPGQPGDPGGAGPAPDLIAPVLSGLAATNKRFAAGSRPTAISSARKGTAFRFSLSEPATVTIAIQRLLPGRKVGGRCRKPSQALRNRKRCTRAQTKGTLTRRTLPAGPASVAFTGRIAARRLSPGSYRAVVVARDAAGNASRPAAVAFKIVRR